MVGGKIEQNQQPNITREKEFLIPIETLAREYQGPHEPLDVSKRNISVYRELIGERERVVT